MSVNTVLKRGLISQHKRKHQCRWTVVVFHLILFIPCNTRPHTLVLAFSPNTAKAVFMYQINPEVSPSDVKDQKTTQLLFSTGGLGLKVCRKQTDLHRGFLLCVQHVLRSKIYISVWLLWKPFNYTMYSISIRLADSLLLRRLSNFHTKIISISIKPLTETSLFWLTLLVMLPLWDKVKIVLWQRWPFLNMDHIKPRGWNF